MYSSVWEHVKITNVLQIQRELQDATWLCKVAELIGLQQPHTLRSCEVKGELRSTQTVEFKSVGFKTHWEMSLPFFQCHHPPERNGSHLTFLEFCSNNHQILSHCAFLLTTNIGYINIFLRMCTSICLVKGTLTVI